MTQRLPYQFTIADGVNERVDFIFRQKGIVFCEVVEPGDPFAMNGYKVAEACVVCFGIAYAYAVQKRVRNGAW